MIRIAKNNGAGSVAALTGPKHAKLLSPARLLVLKEPLFPASTGARAYCASGSCATPSSDVEGLRETGVL